MEFDAAIDSTLIRELDKELAECLKAAIIYYLKPLPGENLEYCLSQLNTTCKSVSSSMTQLLTAASQGNENITGHAGRDVSNSLKNLTSAIRGVAATSTERDVQMRVIDNARDVLEKSIVLFEETKWALHNPHDRERQQRLTQVAKSVSNSVNNCVNCLPGHRDVDESIRNITDATQLIGKELPVSHKSYSDLQTNLTIAATKLNESVSDVIDGSQSPTLLANCFKQHRLALCQLIDCGLEIADHSEDDKNRSQMLNSLKTLSMSSSKLLVSATSVSVNPNAPSTRSQLDSSARSVTESINNLVNVCSSSAPGQKECDSAIRNIQMMRSLLDNPSEPINDSTYFECLETVTEKSRRLGDAMTDIANHAKRNEHKEFKYSVKEASDSICGLLEGAAQSAYLVGSSDPTSVAGRAGLVDINAFHKANEAIQLACNQLCSRSSNKNEILSAATVIAKHTSAFCNSCRVASSKTSNPVAKRHFVQSAKDVANDTAGLIEEIKTLDQDPDSDYNHINCAEATKPLLDAVENLTVFARSRDFVPIPAKISHKARSAQEPITSYGWSEIGALCNMIIAAKTLALNPKDPPGWQTLANHSKNVSDSIKKLVTSIKDASPGQRECDEAVDKLSICIRELDQSSLNIISQNLESRQDNTLKGFREATSASATEIYEHIDAVRVAGKAEAEKLGHSVTQLVSYFDPLVQNAIGCVSKTQNLKQQMNYLDQTKTITKCALQLVYSVKECGGNLQASSVHAVIDKSSESMREALQDLLHTLESAPTEAGQVTGIIESITKSITKINERHYAYSTPSTLPSGSTYVDYQTRMVNTAKEIARIAQDMVGKSTTQVQHLGPLAANLSHSYSNLANDVNGMIGATSNVEVANRIKGSVQELGTACIDITKSADQCQAKPSDNYSQRELTDNAEVVTEKVSYVLAALQAGSRETQACINAASTASGIIGDLDTTIMFAASGTLNAKNENETFANHREAILKTAKAMAEDTKTLVAGAASSQEQLAVARTIIINSGRYKVVNDMSNQIFCIRKAKLNSEGKYTINSCNLKANDRGMDYRITTVDKPSASEGPLNIDSVDKDRVDLSWRAPKDDGGSEITGYVVEKRDKTTGGQCVPAVLHVSPKVTECTVPKLVEEHEYDFRVMAKNTQGLSEQLKTDKAVKVKAPYEVPQRPGQPEVVDSARDFITVKGALPRSDGGSSITRYDVERNNLKGNRWLKVNRDVVKFTDDSVTDCHLYEYRVDAQNAAGVSEPSLTSKPIATKPLKEKPKLHLDGLYGRTIRVRARDSLVINIPMTEAPQPEFKWIINDEPLKPSNRIETQNKDEMISLKIPVSQRSDSGKYAIKATNAYGEDSADIQVLVYNNPSPPRGPLEYQSVTNSTATLNWKTPEDDGGAEIIGYSVEKCEIGSDKWIPAGSCSGTTLTAKSLEEGKQYKFRVMAENMYGISESLDGRPVTAKNPFDTPDSPGQLIVEDYGPTFAAIKWTSPLSDGGRPIQGYLIDKREKGFPDWIGVNSVPTLHTDFTIPNLTEGKSYEFRVIAVNEGGKGKPSKPLATMTAKERKFQSDAPDMPCVKKITKTGVTLSWKKPLNDGGSRITGYIVEKKPKGDKDWEVVIKFPVSDTTYAVPNLIEGNEYEFRIIAVNNIGDSPPSRACPLVKVEDQPNKPEIDVGSVRDITVNAGQDFSINVAFTANPKPTANWSVNNNDIDSVDTRFMHKTSDDYTQLVCTNSKKEYTGKYSLLLKNSCGFDTVTCNVQVLDRPSPPQNVRGEDVEGESLTLKWAPPKDDGGSEVTNYVVKRREVGTNSWTRVSSFANGTALSVRNLTVGRKYDLRVMAENQYGTSDPAQTDESILAKLPFDTPDAPGILRAINTSKDSITMTWTKPSNDGGSPITGYVLEKRKVGDKDWSRALPATIADLTYRVPGLKNNEEYEFRVAAMNAAGTSPFSYASDAIIARRTPTAPKIDADFALKDITVMAGEQFSLKVPFSGSPAPIAEWTVNGKTVIPDDIITSEVNVAFTILLNKKARREDSGKYRLKLNNSEGSDITFCRILVVDVPEAPQGPLDVSNITPKMCSLAWRPPLDDGGNPITNYVVEKQDQSTKVWTKLSGFVWGCHYDVMGIEPNHVYHFRVSAGNQYGVGKALETDDAIINKDPYNKPPKPGRPKIVDYDHTSVTLSWKPPEKNGGRPIERYIVEMKDIFSPNGREVLKTDGPECLATVKDLKENSSVQFRIRAVNTAGAGIPSHATEQHLVKHKNLKPYIDKTNLKDITIKVGGLHKYDVDVRGEPPPTIVWIFSDANIELSDNMNIKIENTNYHSELTICKATRKQSGKYTITATNKSGTDSVTVDLTVLAVPSRPVDPLVVTNIYTKGCELHWQKPDDDGGLPINGYVIEKLITSTTYWAFCGRTGKDNTRFDVIGLTEGKLYQFRVKALNSEGESEPLVTTEPILAKNPYETELTDEHDLIDLTSSPTNTSDRDSDSNSTRMNEICIACDEEFGSFIVCDKCLQSFHLKCHIPEIKVMPDIVFICTFCREAPKLTKVGRPRKSGFNKRQQFMAEKVVFAMICHKPSKQVKYDFRSIENILFAIKEKLIKQIYESEIELIEDIAVMIGNQRQRVANIEDTNYLREFEKHFYNQIKLFLPSFLYTLSKPH